MSNFVNAVGFTIAEGYIYIFCIFNFSFVSFVLQDERLEEASSLLPALKQHQAYCHQEAEGSHQLAYAAVPAAMLWRISSLIVNHQTQFRDINQKRHFRSPDFCFSTRERQPLKKPLYEPSFIQIFCTSWWLGPYFCLQQNLPCITRKNSWQKDCSINELKRRLLATLKDNPISLSRTLPPKAVFFNWRKLQLLLMLAVRRMSELVDGKFSVTVWLETNVPRRQFYRSLDKSLLEGDEENTDVVGTSVTGKWQISH